MKRKTHIQRFWPLAAYAALTVAATYLGRRIGDTSEPSSQPAAAFGKEPKRKPADIDFQRATAERARTGCHLSFRHSLHRLERHTAGAPISRSTRTACSRLPVASYSLDCSPSFRRSQRSYRYTGCSPTPERSASISTSRPASFQRRHSISSASRSGGSLRARTAPWDLRSSSALASHCGVLMPA